MENDLGEEYGCRDVIGLWLSTEEIFVEQKRIKSIMEQENRSCLELEKLK